MEEDIQMGNNHMERRLAAIAIKKMQTKIMIWFNPVKMAKIKNTVTIPNAMRI